MAFSVPPDRSVPKDVAAILRHAAAATQEREIGYFVGGALARDLILFHVFGLPTARATRDVDLMVYVEDWADFDNLKGSLIARGAFAADPQMAHRLLFGRMEVPLDLVPFGGVEGPAGMVAWPPEREVIMSVVAFQEAARTSVPVVVEEGLIVPVVALPVQSLLKLSAWLDRHQQTDKDAIDLLMLLRSYSAAGNTDRLYDQEVELLTLCEFDPELAGARLLAKDAVRLCGVDAVRAVLGRLSEALRGSLEDQMLRQAIQFDDPAFEGRIQQLLTAFLEDLTSAAGVASSGP